MGPYKSTLIAAPRRELRRCSRRAAVQEHLRRARELQQARKLQRARELRRASNT